MSVISPKSGLLANAILKDDIGQINTLLASGAAADEPFDANGNTPMHCAAFHGNIEIIKLLDNKLTELKKDSVQIKNYSGATPLHYASVFGKSEAVKYLTQKNNEKLPPKALKTKVVESLSLQDGSGMTPLHLAVQSGHLSIIKELVDQDINYLFYRNKNGDTVLAFAIEKNQPEIVRYLFEKVKNSLSIADEFQESKVIEYLISHEPALFLTKVKSEYEVAIFNDNFQSNLGTFLKSSQVSEQQKLELSVFLLRKSIESGNLKVMNFLKTEFPQYFAPLVNKIKEDAAIPAKVVTNLNKMLLVLEKDPALVDFSMESVNRFQRFGEITYEEGLLTVAQLKKRKAGKIVEAERQTVDPTVLKEDEFKEFLTALKDATPPIRERFVLSGDHWISGEIVIDNNKNIKVLILDSLGVNPKTNDMHGSTKEVMSSVTEMFPDYTKNIYFGDTRRQHSDKGCSVFALEDARQLFTVERHLPASEKAGGLFGYLEHNIKGERAVGQTTVKMCKLPLSLMTTMQTRKLLEVELPGRSKEEQDAPINPKGQKLSDAVKLENNQNLTLQKKMKNIKFYNMDYILETRDLDSMKAEMNKAGLVGLKKRLLGTALAQQQKDIESIQHQTRPQPQIQTDGTAAKPQMVAGFKKFKEKEKNKATGDLTV